MGTKEKAPLGVLISYSVGGGRSHRQYCLSIPPCLQGNLQGILAKISQISTKTDMNPKEQAATYSGLLLGNREKQGIEISNAINSRFNIRTVSR